MECQVLIYLNKIVDSETMLPAEPSITSSENQSIQTMDTDIIINIAIRVLRILPSNPSLRNASS